MKVIHNRWLPFGTFRAMTIGPFIFTKYPVLPERTLRHEAIHWEQYKEMFIVGFLIVYAVQFVWELIRCIADQSRGRSWCDQPLYKRAYYCMSLEREAYTHCDDHNYLNTRRPYAWARLK